MYIERSILHLEIPFLFKDTATTEIYTLSLHDALPILIRARPAAEKIGLLLRRRRIIDEHHQRLAARVETLVVIPLILRRQDRKSTRLNSSHSQISYAVFCLKKKKRIKKKQQAFIRRLH